MRPFENNMKKNIQLTFREEKDPLVFFKNNVFIYLSLVVLGLHCCRRFSLGAASGGSSLVAAHRLLIAVASLVAEHRL